jgi:hypothetical protein
MPPKKKPVGKKPVQKKPVQKKPVGKKGGDYRIGAEHNEDGYKRTEYPNAPPYGYAINKSYNSTTSQSVQNTPRSTYQQTYYNNTYRYRPQSQSRPQSQNSYISGYAEQPAKNRMGYQSTQYPNAPPGGYRINKSYNSYNSYNTSPSYSTSYNTSPSYSTPTVEPVKKKWSDRFKNTMKSMFLPRPVTGNASNPRYRGGGANAKKHTSS